MQLSGQLHAPATLSPRKRAPGTHLATECTAKLRHCIFNSNIEIITDITENSNTMDIGDTFPEGSTAQYYSQPLASI
jgi:hypothetical protein